MTKILDMIAQAWANKHTSTAAIILFVASVVGVMWPQYKAKSDEIARLAMFYGLLSAGDAIASQPKEPPKPPTPTP